MKRKLIYQCALAALTGVAAPAAYAQDPVSDVPAGTAYNPAPTLEEDLVYLRDRVALQTLRLDETEEMLAEQNKIIRAQAEQIERMETVLQRLAGAAAVQHAAAGDYSVERGDTLSAIARRFDTTVGDLASANNLRPPYTLQVGQTLEVPGAGAPAPQRVAAAPAETTPAPAATADQPQEQSRASQRVAAAEAETTRPTAQSAPEREPQPQRTAAASPARENDDKRPSDDAEVETVGIRPEEEEERPYLALFSDVGGVLTPKGSLYVEPAVDYTTSSDNRFFFQGIEIVDAILIGAIEATDTDRRAVTGSVGMRYGVTDRLEVDARVPYLYRDDRISGVAIDDGTTSVRDLSGEGLGDVEVGLHYQLNNGRNWPYMIANVRAKAPTGQGPFDVNRDLDNSIETELAVGSGFWTVEPSMTFILPSAPASLYANIGYQINLPESPNEILIDTVPLKQTIREFDPGDALRTSLGVGLSLNERLSMNFGYDQSYFFNSTTDIELITREQLFLTALNPETMEPAFVLDEDGNRIPLTDDDGNFLFDDPVTSFQTQNAPSTTVGSFLFGASYGVNDRLRLIFNAAVGATDEAPDARVMFRAQYRLFE